MGRHGQLQHGYATGLACFAIHAEPYRKGRLSHPHLPQGADIARP